MELLGLEQSPPSVIRLVSIYWMLKQRPPSSGYRLVVLWVRSISCINYICVFQYPLSLSIAAFCSERDWQVTFWASDESSAQTASQLCSYLCLTNLLNIEYCHIGQVLKNQPTVCAKVCTCNHHKRAHVLRKIFHWKRSERSDCKRNIGSVRDSEGIEEGRGWNRLYTQTV
jgi:hypothetical protein